MKRFTAKDFWDAANSGDSDATTSAMLRQAGDDLLAAGAGGAMTARDRRIEDTMALLRTERNALRQRIWELIVEDLTAIRKRLREIRPEDLTDADREQIKAVLRGIVKPDYYAGMRRKRAGK